MVAIGDIYEDSYVRQVLPEPRAKTLRTGFCLQISASFSAQKPPAVPSLRKFRLILQEGVLRVWGGAATYTGICLLGSSLMREALTHAHRLGLRVVIVTSLAVLRNASR